MQVYLWYMREIVPKGLTLKGASNQTNWCNWAKSITVTIVGYVREIDYCYDSGLRQGEWLEL